MAFAAVALVPGLAVGSFLNVVAARVPLKRSIVHPGSACMSCSTPAGLVRQHPGALVRAAARPLPALRRRDLLALPGRRGGHRAADRRLRAQVRAQLGRADRERLLRRARRPCRRPTSSGGSSRTGSFCPPPAFVLVGNTLVHPSVEWIAAGLGAARVPPARGARLPGRHGDGRRQARAAARRRPRPHRARRDDDRDALGARAVGRAAGAARQRGAQDGDSVRAVPGSRRRRDACSSGTASSTRTWGCSNGVFREPRQPARSTARRR